MNEAKAMLISLNNNEALRHKAFLHEMYLNDCNSQLYEVKPKELHNERPKERLKLLRIRLN